jgi:predicted Zn-dependent protease
MLFLYKGWAYFVLQQDEQAIKWLRRSVATKPDNPLSQAYLAAALAINGCEAEARNVLATFFSLPQAGVRTLAQWKAQERACPPRYAAFFERLLKGLHQAGMAEE